FLHFRSRFKRPPGWAGFVQKLHRRSYTKMHIPVKEILCGVFASGRFFRYCNTGKNARKACGAGYRCIILLSASTRFTKTFCFYVQVPEDMFFPLRRREGFTIIFIFEKSAKRL